MFKILIFAIFLFSATTEVEARAVKLGDMANQPKPFSKTSMKKRTVVSCLENTDCSFDKECIALQCENVCKNAVCEQGTYCAPAGKDKPHTYQCVQCVVDFHCQEGMFCDKDYVCKKKDPCLNAVCSPAAPFCSPVPYASLPYTCVQCLENEHCPPVAGLTRKCVDGHCLFNVQGNIPAENTGKKDKETYPRVEDEYDDVSYEDEYEDEIEIEYRE